MSHMLTAILDQLHKVDVSNTPIRGEGDIVQQMRALLPEEYRLEGEERAEWYAFTSLEDSDYDRENWTIYFGPDYVRFSDGSTRASYSLKDITPMMVEYWKLRATQCVNPVLVARYAGLVFAFSKLVTTKKPDDDITNLYIKSLIQTVNERRISTSVNCYKKLGRALDLSSKRRLTDLFENAVAAVRSLEKELAQSDKAGTWVKSFELLLNQRFTIPNVLESQIIQELQDRFELCRTAARIDMNGAEAAFSKLAPYFKRLKLNDQLSALVSNMTTLYEQMACRSKPIMADHYYQKMLMVVNDYGEKSELGRIYKLIQLNNPKMNAEFKPFVTEFSIPREEIDDLTEALLSADPLLALVNLGNVFILSRDLLIEGLAAENGIAAIMPKALHDRNGRKVAAIKPLDKDQEPRVIHYYCNVLTLANAIVHYPLQSGRQREIISFANVMSLVKQSYTFAPSRYPIIEKALQAYLDGDFIVAMHLMVPQIEAACLRILEVADEPMLIKGKNDGMNVRIFDNILTDKAFVSIVGDDAALYLRTIFTSNVGWNMRNLICHGMLDGERFEKYQADRVFLVLLYLAGLQQDLSVISPQ